MLLKLSVILFTGDCLSQHLLGQGVSVSGSEGCSPLGTWGVHLPENTATPFPLRWPLKWAVYILLEYIFVSNCSCFVWSGLHQNVIYHSNWQGKRLYQRPTNLCLLYSNPIPWRTPTLPRSNFYRPQRSCGKVMFLQLSVILSTVQSAPVHAGIHTPPGRHTPPADSYCCGWLRTLLEYILVFFIFTISFKKIKTE